MVLVLAVGVVSLLVVGVIVESFGVLWFELNTGKKALKGLNRASVWTTPTEIQIFSDMSCPVLDVV